MNRNPVLNLGIKENRHEQSVNFSEKQRHFLKNLGCIVKGFDDLTITRSCISSPPQNFLAVILNEAVNILVLTYGAFFIKLPPRLRNNCAVPDYNFRSDDNRASRRSVSENDRRQCGGEIKSHSSKFDDGASKACEICKSHRREICATAQQK